MLALESDTVWSSLRYGALSLVQEEQEEETGSTSLSTAYDVHRRMRTKWIETDRETLRQSLQYMDAHKNKNRDLMHDNNLENGHYAENHLAGGCDSSSSSGSSCPRPLPRKVQTFFVSYGSELTEGLQALLDSALLAGVPLHVCL